MSPPERSVVAAAEALAVVHARGGRLPLGAADALAEAGGDVLVVGSGAKEACEALVGRRRFFAETGPGLRPAALAVSLVPVLEDVALLVLPGSPDGRDLAPRLAAALGRPLLSNAVRAGLVPGGPARVHAELARLDDRLLVEVETDGPAVACLAPGATGASPPSSPSGALVELRLSPLGAGAPAPLDARLVGEREADVATMDLAEAARVVAGGYGLAAGRDEATATALFGLLGEVAGALGAALGATRVATDAGWVDHARQIGTTGVAVDPELYVALGVSGAAQHLGGVGDPRTVVSVNLDPSCPMTRRADLGIVADAQALLLELASRLGVPVPEVLAGG